MDSPGKTLEVKIPVQAPINNKPEKTEEEEEMEKMEVYMRLYVEELREKQAMASQGKSLIGKTPVKHLINDSFPKAVCLETSWLPLRPEDPINKETEEEDLSLKKTQENQAMDSPGKSLKGKNPVQAQINNKLRSPICMFSYVEELREKQGMDFPGKLSEVIPRQALINNEQEQEEAKEGWTWVSNKRKSKKSGK
ncbi:unnamed protein product [Eruca vesicaria subsp. sativa]|uniref:Uncharacterized protein n=1 Tax=Eruca vesicaria subsp. sativa TaxID=29727 RepID=A0ABC8JT48_ERUVS|nr:unnamed protein product [Eruca vesicaria subsp. sativa]